MLAWQYIKNSHKANYNTSVDEKRDCGAEVVSQPKMLSFSELKDLPCLKSSKFMQLSYFFHDFHSMLFFLQSTH